MIRSPIVYTEDEIKLIQQKEASPDFNSSTWTDDDISTLKNRIKSYYISEQNNICPYCKQIISSTNGRMWDIEHVIPRSSGKNFMFEPVNLCVSCIDCNNNKSNKKVTNSQALVNLPRNSGQYMIIHPHIDEYNDFILVVKAGLYYVALGEKGRKTIEICGLNRFYQFSNYDPIIETDDRIMMLSNCLVNCNDENQKKALRNDIASICINQNAS